MPVTRELQVTYAGETFGGSSARLIDGWTIVEKDYTTAAFEFSFITTAASAAAFATECAAVEAAFRTPRGNIVVTYGGSTLLSLSQSVNTGLDASPSIIKQGDVADTGRSRYYKVRIEFGLPADNVGTSFRRFSTISVEYSPTRRRTVSIDCTYTANSTDGTTGSFAQYRAQIDAYAVTVLAALDASADFERIGEPVVERNETDKVTNARAVYKEILKNQSTSSTDDSAIVDPVLTITRHRMAPGDSQGTSIGIGSSGTGTTSPGVGGNTVAETPTQTGGGLSGTVQRPTVLTIAYTCGIDSTVTTDIKNKWQSTIRPLLIQQAGAYGGGGVILIEEAPDFGDLYENRFSARMTFHVYSATILSQRITVKDVTSYGKILKAIWTGNPYDYYEYPGPAVRLKTITEEREEVTSDSDANAYVEKLVRSSAIATGLANADKWLVVSRGPGAPVMKRGLDGAAQVYVATCTIETVLQYRNKKSPSVANAGGLHGGAGGVGGGSVAT